ncbi:hypothetical protein XH94_06665 [Bradyrhizobium zhanjiangense]|uniref:Uncharacterized protein n=1 Tax=Bradyrhizobium zhanjiangense TaxID=1325107 RepID=A0A4Q0SP77_9BRAD|nr:hypothetical protein XH94_06665 [Bradyrhizobium zhanjiangense]
MASIGSAQAAFGSASLRPRRSARGVELSLRFGVPACEQGDVVFELDQSIDQPGDHPLRAAVKLRGTLSANGAGWAIRIG